jgi:hypothetical protein
MFFMVICIETEIMLKINLLANENFLHSGLAGK